jgi:hypothetical protein
MDEDEGFIDEVEDFLDEDDEDEDDSSTSPFERHIRRYQHTTRPRKKKTIFNHDRAFDSIQTDFLGPDPLFIGFNFKSMFTISRTRFQRILEDVTNDNQLFYLNKEHIIKGVPTCSLELAFGVPPSCFFRLFPDVSNDGQYSIQAVR